MRAEELPRERVRVDDARRRAEELIGTPAGAPAPAPAAAAAPAAERVREPEAETVRPAAPTVEPTAAAPKPGWVGANGTARPDAEPAGTDATAGLPIPGYDALSASQVVERLAGLSADELGAVHAYESTHRQRRTILGKIEQLGE